MYNYEQILNNLKDSKNQQDIELYKSWNQAISSCIQYQDKDIKLVFDNDYELKLLQ